MSNGQRSSGTPGFGVSRKKQVSKVAHQTPQPQAPQHQVAHQTPQPQAPQHQVAHQPPTQQTPPRQQTPQQQSPQGPHGGPMSLIPVVDLKNPPEAKHGALVLNKNDNLLYYCTSRRWVPVAIADMENDIVKLYGDNVKIVALQGGNIDMQSGDNPLYNGGDVNISSGKGGLGDGEINFKIGGECVLKIAKDGSIKSSVTCGEVKSNEETLELLGTHGILTVNIDIKQDEQISGIIASSLLQESSWLNITAAVDGGGVPQVWLSTPRKGYVTWYLCCIDGVLKNTRLYIEVQNSI